MSETTSNATDEKLEAAFGQLEKNQTESSSSTVSASGVTNGSGSSGFSGILAIFIALIAVGVATYPAYELYQQSSQTDVVNHELKAAVDKLRGDLQARENRFTSLESRLTAADEFIASGQGGVSALEAKFTTELESIRARMGTSSEDWLFAEVEYLVRMANQRVLMEKDAESALQLLLAADQIVRESEGLTAHGLRQALATDVAALKAVEAVDVQGIYLELSALIKQVPKLNRELPAYSPEMPESVEPAASASVLDRATAAIAEAGARLGHLVDFRRGDVEVKPILPPEQDYYLRQNLILKLQIAQMALMEGEGEVFKVALKEALQWVAQSFNADAGSGAMQAALQRLTATEVSAQLPNISGSLNAVRDMLADFHQGEAE